MHALSTAVLVALCALNLSVAGGSKSSEESAELVAFPKEEVMKLHDDCLKELGLTPADKNKPDTKTKILVCMFKKDGTMTEDGKFSADGAIANAATMLKGSPDKVAKITEMATECNKTLAALKVEETVMAKKIHECFHEYQDSHPMTKA